MAAASHSLHPPEMPTGRASRVFVVGCPRSGTTLLQAMLGGHTEVATFPETHFFDRVYGGRRAWALRGLYARAALRRVARTLSAEPPASLPSSLRRGPYARAFIELLDRTAAGQGKRMWLEKTPGHVHFIDRILAVAPGARFIHLLRDGRAVVASLIDVHRRHPAQWSWATTVEACVRRWNRAIRDSLAWWGHPDHMHVSYEELVAGPEPVLRALAGFLGLEFEHGMVEFERQASRVITSQEQWKQGVTGPLSPRGLERYHALLSPRERAFVERSLMQIPARTPA